MTIGCVVLDSCRVDKKSYDKQVVSGQLVYETGQKIINPIPPFIYKRVDPFITNVTPQSAVVTVSPTQNQKFRDLSLFLTIPWPSSLGLHLALPRSAHIEPLQFTQPLIHCLLQHPLLLTPKHRHLRQQLACQRQRST